MSNKKKPVGMALDITTGKSYKVYKPEPETITLTREQAENERLRAGITKAVKHLQRNWCEDRLYALKELEACMTPEQSTKWKQFGKDEQLPPWAADTVDEYRLLLSDAQAERDALMQALADLRDEKNRQISEYKEAWQGFAQRANEAEQRAEHFRAERDALQAELSSLKADMFVLNNDMGYTTGVLDDVLKQRDALQAECDALCRGHDKTHQRIDRALAALQKYTCYSAVAHAVEILTGEGE